MRAESESVLIFILRILLSKAQSRSLIKKNKQQNAKCKDLLLLTSSLHPDNVLTQAHCEDKSKLEVERQGKGGFFNKMSLRRPLGTP